MQRNKELSSYAAQGCAGELCYTIDSFANGIMFGMQKLPEGRDPREFFALRMEDDAGLIRLRSRYILDKKNPLQELELQLMRLSRNGLLGQARLYFGAANDPFYPFEGKFDASIRFLELFKRYTPGLLTIQTRSPLIVIAMPVLRALAERVSVTMCIETPDDNELKRYTPQFSKIDERLKTATTLRRFGVQVNLQTAPVLPYGEWQRDARRFAEILVEHGDYLNIRPFNDGSASALRRLRNSPLAKQLAADRRFHWLRPDSAQPLINAVERLAPEKLELPEYKHLAGRQLHIFAA